jgi:hypothetical protein
MSQMKLHPDSTRIHPSFSCTSSSSGGGKQTMHHLIVASRFWRALEIVEKWPASVLFSDAVFASQ